VGGVLYVRYGSRSWVCYVRYGSRCSGARTSLYAPTRRSLSAPRALVANSPLNRSNRALPLEVCLRARLAHSSLTASLCGLPHRVCPRASFANSLLNPAISGRSLNAISIRASCPVLIRFQPASIHVAFL